MGNTWKGISNEKLINAEVALIKRSGLKDDDWRYHNINIEDKEGAPVEIDFSSNQESENYLHCIEIKRKDIKKDLPTLVLTHGYGAGIGIFYRVLFDLAEYFHVYAVDLLGMGASGRPTFTATNVSDAEDFFVEPLRIFIDKMGITGEYYLAGHSLGGYLVTVFALRYPERIIQLILLSPVGIPEKPSTFNTDEVA